MLALLQQVSGSDGRQARRGVRTLMTAKLSKWLLGSVLCVVFVGTAGCGSSSTVAEEGEAEEEPSAALAPEGPAQQPAPGGPHFLLVPPSDTDGPPAYGWYARGDGAKTRLESIRGIRPVLLEHGGELWLLSHELQEDETPVFWRQKVTDEGLEAAIPHLFDEHVSLSFDGRYGLYERKGVRLYESGQNAPIAELGSDAAYGARWSPTAPELFFVEPRDDDQADLYYVEIGDDGTVREPRLLATGTYEADPCRWSPDGRWLAFSHMVFSDDAVEDYDLVILDRERDFARREVGVEAVDGRRMFWFSADSQFFVSYTPYPEGKLSFEPTAGGERYELAYPPDSRVTSHPSANWVGVVTPDGAAELVTLHADGPSRTPLVDNGADAVWFGTTTERLLMGGLPALDRVLVADGSGFEMLYQLPEGSVPWFTGDLSHVVIASETELSSLRVAPGARPEPLGVEMRALAMSLPSPFPDDHVALTESDSEFTRLHVVSWPDDVPQVSTIDFDEPSLTVTRARPFVQAGVD